MKEFKLLYLRIIYYAFALRSLLGDSKGLTERANIIKIYPILRFIEFALN